MAFQRGAFQFGAFQMAYTPPSTVLMPGKAAGAAFTRKRFDELMAAWRAQEALEAKARESTGKRRQVLETAAKAAADTLLAIEELQTEAEAHAQAADLVTLTNALKAAESARYVSDVVRQARLAREYALAMQAEDDDEEEEAISLLIFNG